jgi:hypothetical protein
MLTFPALFSLAGNGKPLTSITENLPSSGHHEANQRAVPASTGYYDESQVWYESFCWNFKFFETPKVTSLKALSLLRCLFQQLFNIRVCLGRRLNEFLA